MKTITTYEDLVQDLIDNKVTMVRPDEFKTIFKHYLKISEVEGDVVECGVWRGGFSIFLSYIFQDKNVWVCDSYEGCQNPSDGNYHFEYEQHTKGMYAISLETVKDNFIKNNLPDDKRINFLKGWVKDTLKPEICPIKDIALLRIDVDSYSATLEVLDYLYSKVKSGGIIIFDDSCLSESHHAMITFLEREPNIIFKHTSTGETIDIKSGNSLPCGCYFIKP